MSRLVAIFAVLRHGASLTDPAVWKQRQNTVNILVAFLGAVFVLFPVGVSREDIELIAGGVAVLLGLFNGYFTTATTDKIGFGPPVRPDDRDQGPDIRDPGP